MSCHLVSEGGKMFDFRRKEPIGINIVRHILNIHFGQDLAVSALKSVNKFIVIEDDFISYHEAKDVDNLIPDISLHPLSNQLTDLLAFIRNPETIKNNYIILMFSENKKKVNSYIISREWREISR